MVQQMLDGVERLIRMIHDGEGGRGIGIKAVKGRGQVGMFQHGPLTFYVALDATTCHNAPIGTIRPRP